MMSDEPRSGATLRGCIIAKPGNRAGRTLRRSLRMSFLGLTAVPRSVNVAGMEQRAHTEA